MQSLDHSMHKLLLSTLQNRYPMRTSLILIVRAPFFTSRVGCVVRTNTMGLFVAKIHSVADYRHGEAVHEKEAGRQNQDAVKHGCSQRVC
jgi:hypothetical protein